MTRHRVTRFVSTASGPAKETPKARPWRVTDSLFAALIGERQPHNIEEALMDNDSRPDVAGEAPSAGPAGEGPGPWDGSSVYAGAPESLDQRPAGKRPYGEGKTSAEVVAWGERLAAAVMAVRERDVVGD
jgi:hypothetical protein